MALPFLNINYPHLLKHLLIIRFSALGDTAAIVPVIYGLANTYPFLKITLLSRQRFATLMSDMPSNVYFFGADLTGVHKGLHGLNRLLRDLDYKQFDAVADMHDVWRSKYLRLRMKMAGKPIAHINKGRHEKHQLTRFTHKCLKPLTPVTERYLQVLHKLGLVCTPALPEHFEDCRSGIGIAPFAAHKGKIYPLERMEQVVEILSKKGEKLYLFGAGIEETAILKRWADMYNNVEIVAGRNTLQEELQLMSHLKVMLTMDSANMHLASLAGTRVVSIYGCTHPYSGFYGFGQDPADCIQTDLPCRPCSIYGNRRCRYNDYRCFDKITPEQIVEKLTTP